MIPHAQINEEELRTRIKHYEIKFGGNLSLKIYGKLSCLTGKRMKKQHRVFFASAKEAIEKGFRPCGNCMNNEYKK